MSEPMRYCGVDPVALVRRDRAATVAFHAEAPEMPPTTRVPA